MDKTHVSAFQNWYNSPSSVFCAEKAIIKAKIEDYVHMSYSLQVCSTIFIYLVVHLTIL
jgi:hypothetical protein